MDRQLHHHAVQRALALGRGTDPAALLELARLLTMPSAEIRRLAASGIGKLASFGADANAAVQALAPVAMRDPHPQTQQYALKGRKAYGAAAREHLHDLDDLALNERVKDYVRRAAHSAAEAIREAIRLEQEGARHKCARCGRETTAEEHTRSQQAFQRTFCDSCFDEVFLGRRNFDTKVELNKAGGQATHFCVSGGQAPSSTRSWEPSSRFLAATCPRPASASHSESALAPRSLHR